MTTPPCTPDPVAEVVQTVAGALLEVFSPDQLCPPVGGGGDTVRFFAGDAAPMSAWDAHASGAGCTAPFLWVRLMRRYRSRVFPNPTVATDCGLIKVVPVEIGVGRCAVTDPEPKWSDWADEANTSMGDSHRIEGALCMAMDRLRSDDKERAVGTDTINPYGPEGGVVAWSGILYASYS